MQDERGDVIASSILGKLKQKADMKMALAFCDALEEFAYTLLGQTIREALEGEVCYTCVQQTYELVSL